MKLSIVVIFYNMRREAARTLYTLSKEYQREIGNLDCEVIAIDNGSTQPLDPDMVASFGPNFQYHFHESNSVSPVDAVNHGASMAKGDVLAVIVDGARMASPGLIRQSLTAMAMSRQPFVGALAWHLGPEIQPRSIQHGYDQAVEDKLLDAIDWHRDGYQLFSISSIAPSSRQGFLGDLPTELGWFCIPRERFTELGGFNPAFQTPGGGLCNQEFRNRVATSAGTVSTVVLGEGTFHQTHGGAATGALPNARPNKVFQEEYAAIIGKPFSPAVPRKLTYAGSVTDMARPYLVL